MPEDYPKYILAFSWIIFALVWLVTLRTNKKTLEVLPGQWWWREFPLLVILLLFFCINSGITPSLTFLFFEQTPFSAVAGSTLSFFGLSMLLWSRYTLGSNWSEKVTLKRDHALITTGPYAYVRHPIYTGIFSFLLTTMLIFPNAFIIIASLTVIGSFLYKAKAEEALLVRHFSQKYTDYQNNTKMIIPFLF